MNRFRKLFGLLRRRASWGPLIATGTAMGFEHLDMLEFVKPKFVVDVGANKGQFSLSVVSLDPTVQIVAFEPLPSELAKFKNNFKGKENVQVVPKVISDASGAVTLHVTNRLDSSSLFRPSDVMGSAFNVAVNDTVTVESTTLDEFFCGDAFTGPVLLKLDVQGAELKVLMGGRKFLKVVDFIYLEASYSELYVGQPLYSDLEAELRSEGFRLAGVYNQCLVDGQPVQADFLFERSMS